jgi:prolyl oligopeptidase
LFLIYFFNLCNINFRGGSEMGPDWHQAALKDKRHKAYEDFIAVAEDLIKLGVTSVRHLAIRGGSNGGLLVGNMMTMRPDLFGAIVCAVPLLDMKRYNHLLAGASWMAEYGDPDKDDDWCVYMSSAMARTMIL